MNTLEAAILYVLRMLLRSICLLLVNIYYLALIAMLWTINSVISDEIGERLYVWLHKRKYSIYFNSPEKTYSLIVKYLNFSRRKYEHKHPIQSDGTRKSIGELLHQNDVHVPFNPKPNIIRLLTTPIDLLDRRDLFHRKLCEQHICDNDNSLELTSDDISLIRENHCCDHLLEFLK